MKRIAIMLLLLVATPTASFAHGDLDHFLGTIAVITEDRVTVLQDGKEFVIYLRESTKYERAGKVSVREELKVGDRVVIHAKKNDGMEVAYEVRFMHPKKD